MITALALLLLSPPNAADLADQSTGLWTSAAQSADPAYDFVASEKVRIFPDKEDVWVYQQNWILGENASDASAVSIRHDRQPYFQVVIRFRDFGDGAVHTTTYRLDPSARAAARSVLTGAAFDEDWLGETACMGRLQAIGTGHWQGSANCPNGYKGGVRVDSRSIRTPDSYVNWDRGFDLEGNHIWGPAAGGYIFKRWEETP